LSRSLEVKGTREITQEGGRRENGPGRAGKGENETISGKNLGRIKRKKERNISRN